MTNCGFARSIGWNTGNISAIVVVSGCIRVSSPFLGEEAGGITDEILVFAGQIS